MKFPVLIIFWIMNLAAWGAQERLSVEGYGEGFFFAEPGARSNASADMMVEPTLHLSDKAKLCVAIGFQHPSEEGGMFEAELEALSLDVRVNGDTDLSLGKVHMPIGLYNLYHEPIYFLTLEPSRVEHLIIPAEWHESAALLKRRFGEYTVIAGVMSGMEASKLQKRSWIREGKESHLRGDGKPGWLARVDYGTIENVLMGGSVVTTPLLGSGASATLVEAHASVRLENGWEAMAIASRGWISDIDTLPPGVTVDKRAEGASMTIGYDIGRDAALSVRKLLLFGHTEYARPARVMEEEGLGGSAWSTGLNWYLSPRVVAKAEYRESTQEGKRAGIGIGFVY